MIDPEKKLRELRRSHMDYCRKLEDLEKKAGIEKSDSRNHTRKAYFSVSNKELRLQLLKARAKVFDEYVNLLLYEAGDEYSLRNMPESIASNEQKKDWVARWFFNIEVLLIFLLFVTTIVDLKQLFGPNIISFAFVLVLLILVRIKSQLKEIKSDISRDVRLAIEEERKRNIEMKEANEMLNSYLSDITELERACGHFDSWFSRSEVKLGEPDEANSSI